MKPVASAGADGVTFCANRSEVIRAAEAVLGKKNKLGDVNDAVVLQEKISGQQYIVNAVSIGGRHYISEIWRDDKIHVPGASLICDREILLSPGTPLTDALEDYVIRCLDALGVREGPSHSELFKTDGGDLVLIETAARMQGTIDHEAVIEATGHSHVTLTALRYADPDSFSKLLGARYARRSHLHCITLCAQRSGIVKDNRSLHYLSALKSFRSLMHTPQKGEPIYRTVDLFTNSGIVYLANENEKILEFEYQFIRRLESSGKLISLL